MTGEMGPLRHAQAADGDGHSLAAQFHGGAQLRHLDGVEPQ